MSISVVDLNNEAVEEEVPIVENIEESKEVIILMFQMKLLKKLMKRREKK